MIAIDGKSVRGTREPESYRTDITGDALHTQHRHARYSHNGSVDYAGAPG